MSNPARNQKGIALMLAMFTIVLVSYLATELAYETNVEYLINSQAVQGVKAYYAAKAGIQLSLLRLKIYSQVTSQLSPAMKNNIKPDIIDMIWKMPFSWPPNLPSETSKIDKSGIDASVADSLMDASYFITTVDEGSLIDVNDLGSPAKALRDLTKKRLLDLFESKRKNDDLWAQQHSDLRPEDIINSIQDWVTPGSVSASGGDKGQRYGNMGPGYPPNRAFRTVQEVRLVPGVTEDVFQVLQDQITVFGMRALNPNHVPKEVFMSLDPTITSQIADELVARREDLSKGGPYKSGQDLWQAVAGYGGRVDALIQENLPIVVDSVYNFKIKSVGNFKNTTREVTTVVFDVSKTASQLAQALQTAGQTQTGGSGQTQQQNPTPQKNSPSKGPPRIVYWTER